MTKLLLRLFVKNYKEVKDSSVRQKYGLLSSIVGIVTNFVLFGAKLFAAVLTGSVAVISDAFNNLSDAGSSIVSLVGFKIANAPADDKHPFGHGRAEYLSGLVISFIITYMGIQLAISSVEKIVTPEDITIDTFSLVILIFAVLVKLWLFLFNRKLGKSIGSVTIIATSTDSLSDVVATSSVIIGILVFIFTGVNIDAYIGLIVAGFIAYSGIKTALSSISPLLGQMPDSEFVKDIEKTVCDYSEIIGVHDLIIHNYGVGNSVISLHAEVPAKMDFLAAHELIDIIEDDLKIKYRCHALIHMDPVVTDDPETNELREKINDIILLISPSLSIHDFRMTKGVVQANLIFDVVVPFKFKLSDDELVEIIRNSVHQINEKYSVVINIDKKMNELD